jgi:hypothetical protein
MFSKVIALTPIQGNIMIIRCFYFYFLIEMIYMLTMLLFLFPYYIIRRIVRIMMKLILFYNNMI